MESIYSVLVREFGQSAIKAWSVDRKNPLVEYRYCDLKQKTRDHYESNGVEWMNAPTVR